MIVENAQQLAERIEKLCSGNGISANRMLNISGAGERLIQNLKKGSLPSIDKIYKIADYFNVSVDYLLGRTNVSNLYIKGVNIMETTLKDNIKRLFKKNSICDEDFESFFNSLPDSVKKEASTNYFVKYNTLYNIYDNLCHIATFAAPDNSKISEGHPRYTMLDILTDEENSIESYYSRLKGIISLLMYESSFDTVQKYKLKSILPQIKTLENNCMILSEDIFEKLKSISKKTDFKINATMLVYGNRFIPSEDYEVNKVNIIQDVASKKPKGLKHNKKY